MGNKHSMPQARTFESLPGLQWDVTPQARERWAPNLSATVKADNTISILDPIGVDMWTGEGVTAKRIAAALRSIGDQDVVVNINSPGGDLFEGLAIYNLLREHNRQVTVKVLGLAASAASIIAMAGDEIQIARAGFFMVHNGWVVALGNRHDLRDIADWLEPFDLAIADIYMARTGLDMRAVQKKMDAETWINGSAAVDEGWADSLLAADQVAESKDAQSRAERSAQHTIDTLMAKAGIPRGERRAMVQDFKAGMLRASGGNAGTPRAAGAGTPSAADDGTPSAAMTSLLSDLKSFSLEKEIQQ